jgi:uncharacterized protein (TIGR03435 family)
MILKYMSAIWAAGAPALGNHLWQSTLCLAVTGLATLVLRRNHAQARYGLWLAASVKFLVPFALLVAVGIHFARPSPILRPAPAGGFYLVMNEVSQPFTKTAGQSRASEKSRRPAQGAGLRYQLARGLPAMLLAVWLGGFLAVLIVWWRRWRGLSAALRGATPLREGREAEALRRAARLGGIRRPIHLMLSPASLEPGIFGIVKPLLVWPQGISERLDDAQLAAILAHEVCHVRRRDNLAAAIHMVVEAVFWFHPLVWWLGTRLVQERERACDEKVVELGSERQVYAESILKTCEFCLESPLACVAGVTSANLKERIVRVMTQRRAKKLSFARQLMLVAIGIAAVAGPVVYGLLNIPQVRAQATQTSAAPPAASFEVASILPNHSAEMKAGIMFQPGRFTATAVPVKRLIAMAYEVKDFQVTGGPSWINSERYDIKAKEPDSVAGQVEGLPFGQRGGLLRSMVQSLLSDRFKLKLSRETKELPVYALMVAKNGPKLIAAKPDDNSFHGIKGPREIKNPGGYGQMGLMRMGGGELEGHGTPVSSLAYMLSEQLSRTVLDRTGLTGNYDFTLKWAPEPGEEMMLRGPEGGNPGPESAPPPETSGPSIFTAIQEQLGLKLESTKGPVEVLVIEHIEKPTEN